MSWMQKLYETYQANAGQSQASSDNTFLLPLCHTPQKAHIEIVLDESGVFKRAAVIDRLETIIPATEQSSGRTTNDAPHALCDKIQYVAEDYGKSFGGKKKPYFKSYHTQLEEWCAKNPHPKAQAVLRYISKGRVVADLVEAGILHIDKKNGFLIISRPDTSAQPAIFQVLPKHPKKKDAGKPVQDQGDAFVRWRVESPGVPMSGTWEDDRLIQAWMDYVIGDGTGKGLCLITGKDNDPIAKKHPKRLRHSGDGARLISSNDLEGYTFRGRFASSEQAASVSSIVTQKAHSALRWLIARQGYRNGSQVIMAWAISGKSIPDPFADSDLLFSNTEEQKPETETINTEMKTGDAGQVFARRLSKMIAGYKAQLGPTEDIVVLGLDSATSTSGRMAVTFYRDLTGSEFLDRLEDWHSTYAWFQNYSRERKFVGAPAPKDIAFAAFGRRLDDKLSRTTVERLLPCIIDARPLPGDLMESVVRRTSNRIGMEWWEWEKALGIACSLFKGFHKERGYLMVLETDRRTRDYLYGRLLAIAEQIERRALYLSDENRDTTAARLMHRFIDHPYSTWLNIWKGLQPYMSRLQVKRPEFLYIMKGLLDGVHVSFDAKDYMDDRPLSGEALLGYHCQRMALNPKDNRTGPDDLLENEENLD